MREYVREQTIRVTKLINAPIGFVFAWCTDFQESDYEIIGSKKKRTILLKTKSRVIYYQTYAGGDGSWKNIVNIVSIRPPNRWHLEYFGEDDDEIGDYRLKAIGVDKTRLEMVFKEKWKTRKNIPSIRQQVKESSKFWDKFISKLMEDFGKSANK